MLKSFSHEFGYIQVNFIVIQQDQYIHDVLHQLPCNVKKWNGPSFQEVAYSCSQEKQVKRKSDLRKITEKLHTQKQKCYMSLVILKIVNNATFHLVF